MREAIEEEGYELHEDATRTWGNMWDAGFHLVARYVVPLVQGPRCVGEA